MANPDKTTDRKWYDKPTPASTQRPVPPIPVSDRVDQGWQGPKSTGEERGWKG